MDEKRPEISRGVLAGTRIFSYPADRGRVSHWMTGNFHIGHFVFCLLCRKQGNCLQWNPLSTRFGLQFVAVAAILKAAADEMRKAFLISGMIM